MSNNQINYNSVKPQVNAENIIKDNIDETEFKMIAQAEPAKPPISRRLNHFVFGNEGFSGVAKGIVHNVFIPVIKRAIMDTGSSVLHRIIYPNGEVGPSTGYYGYHTPKSYNTYTPWNSGVRPSNNISYYNQPTRVVDNQYDKKFAQSIADTVFEVQRFQHKEQAEDVFRMMLSGLDRSGRITLGDYLTMCGYRPDASKWSFGWRDLSTSKVLPHIQGGYYIDLPQPIVL